MTTTTNGRGGILPVIPCILFLAWFPVLSCLDARAQPPLAQEKTRLEPAAYPPPWKAKEIEQARRLVTMGDVRQADTSFKEALKLAGSAVEKATLTLEYADALSRNARLRGNSGRLAEKAALLYKKVIPVLSGEPKVKAANNLGSLLLRRNRPKEALDALLAAQPETVHLKGPPKARYLYNLGRALEENGKAGEGLRYYQDASMEDPSFDPAARAALRLLGAVRIQDRMVPRTARWVSVLVENGETGVPEKALCILLREAPGLSPRSANLLLGTLVRYLALASIHPDAFQAQWLPRLERLAKTRPGTRAAVSYLRFLYLENTQPDFNFHRARYRARALSGVIPGPDPFRIISTLCTVIGGYYLDRKDVNRALSAYASAWTADTTNTTAAYASARLLLDFPKQIPRSGDILDEFIVFLFMQKGRAYLGEDWPNILRFHLVLASIYTGKGQWGSPGDPHGAVFQLEHAIKAHARVKRSGRPGDAGPIAKVKQRLAWVYEQKGELRRAGRIYLDAMKTAIGEDNEGLAKEIAARLLASPAGYGIPEDQIDRLKDIAGGQERIAPL